MRKFVKHFVMILLVGLLLVQSTTVFAAAPRNTTTPTALTLPAPTLGYSPMTPTSGNVTVTVYFPTGSTNKQYRVGTAGIWTPYKAPFIMTANGYITARYQNNVGTWSTLGGVTVSNIDRLPPANPTFNASTTALTNQNVTVGIFFSSDASVKQYKIGSSGVWTHYSTAVVLNTNATLFAKAADAAGNWTTVVSYEVTNIDQLAPPDPIFSSSNVNPTNQQITVDIGFSSDTLVKQYQIGSSGSWMNHTAPIVIEDNGTIYAKGADAAGNWTTVVSYEVQNIDRLGPLSPTFSSSNTNLTNQDVTVTIDYSADSSLQEYRFSTDFAWSVYLEPIVVPSNAVIEARSSDVAGNYSDLAQITIDNIDKNPPSAPEFNVSTTVQTNQNVIITVSYPEDTQTQLYQIGDLGQWQIYIEPVTFSNNENIYAKSVDAAGNESLVSSYVVENIDLIAPVAPLMSPSTIEKTDQAVTLTAIFSNDSVNPLYKVGETGVWVPYTSPITVTKNVTIYAKAMDLAGNESVQSSYTINNIVKTVLAYTVKYTSTDVSSYNALVAHSSAIDEITTATFSVDGNGVLTGTAPMDQMNYAASKGIRTKLMVSNNFDSAIAKQLLDSSVNRQNLINNILNFLTTYHYTGVDIDIENIPASCRDNFTALLSELYGTLKPLGYEVSVAVQAKTYDSPQATWNYAFDYQALGMYCDYLMIMAYDEHYASGPAGAVASISWVNNVVNYALTVVPKEKIILGLAAYGYDWSTSATRSYSMNGCANLAAQYGATIFLDDVTKSKYFTYTAAGINHMVWFEDGETLGYKMDLVNQKDLKGIGLWRLGLENNGFWSTVSSKFNK